jgi:hypothetical protein
MSRRHVRRGLLGASLALLFSLQSCCTTVVWTARGGTHHHGNDVAWRVLLTPFAVFVDLLTLPLQAAWLDGCHPHPHCCRH